MKLFTVVILHYNAPVFLEGALDSVCRAAEGMDAEVIVADNASANFDTVYFRRRYPKVKFILFDRNYGFSKGNNLAIRQARGEYVILLNPDVLVPENIFKDLLRRIEDIPDLGVAGVRLIDGTGSFLPESKRRIPSLRGAIGKLLFDDHRKGYYYDNLLGVIEEGKTYILPGAFMLFRRDRFWETGGFDERYFMYGEDVDLSYSFLKSGYTNYYFGSLAVVHFKGESTPDNLQYRKYFIESNIKFYEKYHFSNALLLRPLLKLGSWLLLGKKRAEKGQIPNRLTGRECINYQGNRPEIEQALKKLYGRELVRGTGVCDSGIIIYDLTENSLKEAIDKMWGNRGKNLRYRFVTVDGKWLFGSDSAAGKGEIAGLE